MTINLELLRTGKLTDQVTRIACDAVVQIIITNLVEECVDEVRASRNVERQVRPHGRVIPRNERAMSDDSSNQAGYKMSVRISQS